jgi:hypothetical protein
MQHVSLIWRAMFLCAQAVEELPAQESPELFGLHANADLTFRTLQAQAAVQTVLDTRPAGGASGGGLSREEVVDRICEDLLSKVPNEAAVLDHVTSSSTCLCPRCLRAAQEFLDS